MRFSRIQPLLLVLALSLGARHVAAAQDMTGVPAVDSATVARTAWARAADAIQHGNDSTARRELDRAATAWPTQPAYVWTRALLAARDGDTASAFEALRQYADLGLGRDLKAEKYFAAAIAAATPSITTLLAAHDANRSPIANSHVRAVLRDSSFWPEGMDVDPATGRFYLASVRHRTIAELDSLGHSRELWPRDRHDLGAILGVRFDAKRRVLWATKPSI